MVRLKLHESLNPDRVMAAADGDDGAGFCIYCGIEQNNTEPDARSLRCWDCGRHGVFGAELLLAMTSGLDAFDRAPRRDV